MLRCFRRSEARNNGGVKLKKNFLTAMICAAFFLILFGAGGAAEPPGVSITGVWVIGSPFNPIEKAIQRIEFKADGAFTMHWDYNPNIFNPFKGNPDLINYASGMMYDRINTPGIFTFKGKYSLSGDKITLTNVTNSFKAGAGAADTGINVSPAGDYSDELAGDIAASYELWAGGEKHEHESYTEYNCLYLVGFLGSRLHERYYQPRITNGIELWPKTLPDSLCPAGFNGVAQSYQKNGLNDMYDIAEAFGNDDNSWIGFTVYIHNAANLASFQPYRDKLTSDGFVFRQSGDSWTFEKNIAVKGITYGLEIYISDSGSNPKITYNFRTYGLY
jgi:hypothetical protein